MKSSQFTTAHCSSAVKMNCKIFILLALATVVVQAYAPYRVEDETILIETDRLGESLIDKLEELVKNAINTAKEKLKNLFNGFVNTVKSIINGAKEALTKQLKNLVNELNELKEEAKALSINITDCLKDNEANLLNLPKKYTKRIIQCGDNAITEAKGIIHNAQDRVDASIKEVTDLKDEFKACGSGWSAIPCKTRVSYKIGKTIAFLPVDIIEIAADAVPEIWSLNGNLTYCNFQESKAFYNEGKQIIKDINLCVQDKIHPPQNSTTEVPPRSTEPPQKTTTREPQTTRVPQTTEVPQTSRVPPKPSTAVPPKPSTAVPPIPSTFVPPRPSTDVPPRPTTNRVVTTKTY